MAPCESCGTEKPADRLCPRCGYPLLTGEASRLLGEAADLAEVGQSDLALRKIQQAAKSAGDSWLPRLKLALIYDGKVALGETALQSIADREFSEAMRLGPQELAVHAARIERIAKRGGLPLLRAEYGGMAGTLPVAGECLNMIDALEKASALAGKPVEVIPPPGQNYRAKMFLVSALLTALCTFGMMIKVLMMNREDSAYIFVGGPDFWASLVFLTASLVLGLEFLRASGKLKKK